MQALNHAYSQATGTVITTLDADDALDPGYFSYLRDLPEGTDAFVRDYIVVDNSLRRIGTYRMSNDLLAASVVEVVSGLISLPRATWTVRRPVAEKVFPIPTGLPFEDVWFSLTIKRFALRIENPRREMYYYRQHDGQTFGGVLNYHPEKTRFRARRLYAYATLLPTHVARLEIDALPDMGNTQVFYSLMSQENLPLLSILRADLCPRSKAKLLLFRKLWFLVAIAKRVQWKLESGRARDNQ